MTRYEKLDEMLEALTKEAGAEWYALIEEGKQEPSLYSCLGVFRDLEDKALHISYLNAIANRGHTIVNVKLSNGAERKRKFKKAIKAICDYYYTAFAEEINRSKQEEFIRDIRAIGFTRG